MAPTRVNTRLNQKSQDLKGIRLSSEATLARAEGEAHVLTQVLSHLAAAPGTVVFDLDSTLLDNRHRQAQIVRDFGSLRRQPGFAALGAEHFEDWDLRRALRKAGVEAATAEGLHAALRTSLTPCFPPHAYSHP